MIKGLRLAGIALLVAGALSLVYGAFGYTKDAYRLHAGNLELVLKDRETVHIPIWAGVATVLAGGLLLILPGRRWGT